MRVKLRCDLHHLYLALVQHCTADPSGGNRYRARAERVDAVIVITPQIRVISVKIIVNHELFSSYVASSRHRIHGVDIVLGAQAPDVTISRGILPHPASKYVRGDGIPVYGNVSICRYSFVTNTSIHIPNRATLHASTAREGIPARRAVSKITILIARWEA